MVAAKKKKIRVGLQKSLGIPSAMHASCFALHGLPKKELYRRVWVVTNGPKE